jgi:hypothetical protein
MVPEQLLDGLVVASQTVDRPWLDAQVVRNAVRFPRSRGGISYKE